MLANALEAEPIRTRSIPTPILVALCNVQKAKDVTAHDTRGRRFCHVATTLFARVQVVIAIGAPLQGFGTGQITHGRTGPI